jgi:hypothetical protein
MASGEHSTGAGIPCLAAAALLSRRPHDRYRALLLLLLLLAAGATTLDAFPPPANCSATMNMWCSTKRNCAAEGASSRVALHDTNPKHAPPMWRCYPPSDLNAALTAYVKGGGICTRDAQLKAVLARCMSGAPPLPPPPPPPPPPQPLGVEVFAHGMAGYPCIRTPAIVSTRSGALLAFAGTRSGAGDGCVPTVPYNKSVDYQDNVMRRSTDRGRTWGPIRSINRAGKNVHNHGAALFDWVHNRTVQVMNTGPNTSVGMAVIRSSDDGSTWSAPRVLSELGKDVVQRVSPGRGLQLGARNKWAGRLLFVAQKGTNVGNIVFYSDDGGETFVESKTMIEHCNEAQMVELADGTVLLVRRPTCCRFCSHSSTARTHVIDIDACLLLQNARDEDGRRSPGEGVPMGVRRFSRSSDGGESWQALGELREGLGNQNCMGSFLSAGDDVDAPLLFSHPDGPGTRSNGTIWISRDQARSFEPLTTVTRTPGGSAKEPFAYSCLTTMDSAAASGDTIPIGLLYETGDAGCTGPSCRIMFMTVEVHNRRGTSMKTDDDVAATAFPRRIVVASVATQVERWSADRLADLLALPIVNGGNAAASTAGAQIAVGYGAAVTLGVDPRTLATLGNDACLVSANRSRGIPIGSVAIASNVGSARGTMNGAFAFLRALGFEFLAQDETVKPAGQHLVLPSALDIWVDPPMESRDMAAVPVAGSHADTTPPNIMLLSWDPSLSLYVRARARARACVTSSVLLIANVLC